MPVDSVNDKYALNHDFVVKDGYADLSRYSRVDAHAQ